MALKNFCKKIIIRKLLGKHRSMGPFLYQNGRQIQKVDKKMKILTLVDLNCLKTAINRNVHCWKAYLIGYNFVIQTIALKCNPDFSRLVLQN